jgi:hypothetical protein
MKTMIAGENTISIDEFKGLLKELHNKQQGICIRYRLLGEIWTANFTRMLYVTEKGAILNNEKNNQVIFIDDLKTVMQFELDTPFQNFEPRVQYKINLYVA